VNWIRRLFTKREKDALYSASDGLCEECGKPLESGWHADHVHPWSRGGDTVVSNGQALCANCNLRKGSSMRLAVSKSLPVWSSSMREWQEEAVAEYHKKAARQFLIVATPGAGKTKAALRVAHDLLCADIVRRIVVVTPSTHLKSQWQEAAADVGIDLAADVRGAREPADHHGCCVTYHQVFSEASVQRANTRDKTLVIFDEIHHAGDGNGWGETIHAAFENAERVLCLSGTPFRSDNRRIPFVTYSEGKSVSDYSYSYGDALSDEIVRDVYFPQYEGQVVFYSTSQQKVVDQTFASDVEDDKEESERLKAALMTDWMDTVIKDADARLQEVRNAGHPHAAGLITCMDQAHADEIAGRVRRITSVEPDVIKSENDESHRLLAMISRGDRVSRWIVCIAMVTEGVDIPSLRVGIYATNKTTELFFRQFVGRMARRIKGLDNDSDAWVYLPADSRIVEIARRIKEEREHVLDERIAKTRERIAMLTNQLSMFSAVSGQAFADGCINDGQVLYQDELVEAERHRKAMSEEVGVILSTERAARLLRYVLKNVSHTTPEPVAGVEKAKFELRHDLRQACHDGVKRACVRNDYDFADVNVWLNQQVGVFSVKDATIEQLKERLRLINEVLLPGKWKKT
jgi:superfamily II DNA or RNA helicase